MLLKIIMIKKKLCKKVIIFDNKYLNQIMIILLYNNIRRNYLKMMYEYNKARESLYFTKIILKWIIELPKRQAWIIRTIWRVCKFPEGVPEDSKDKSRATLKAFEKKKELLSLWQIVLYFDTASGEKKSAVETDESAVSLMESEGLQRREHGFPFEECS